MKAKQIKQGFLALLCIALVYIWWGNLKLFLGQGEEPDFAYEVPGGTREKVVMPASIPYRPPQVNPFRRNVPRPNSSQQTGILQPPRPVEFLHDTHRLSGVLPFGKHAQVTVLDSQNKTAVLEIGDSLRTWQLTAVGNTCAVFKQRKRYDTLWLSPPKR